MKKLITFILWIIFILNIFNISYAVNDITTKEIKSNFEKTYVLNKMAKNWFLNRTLKDYFNTWYKDIYNIYLSYDYINKTESYKTLISAKKEVIKYLKENDTWALSKLTQSLNSEMIWYLSVNELEWFPKDLRENDNFKYMIEWIKNDEKTIKTVKEISKTLWIDYRLVISSILTEQVRYAMTERGEMKKFLNKVPILIYLTQFSYWIWGIKSFTAEKIRDDAKIYGYWKELEVHNKITWETKWKEVLTNEYWQVVYPAYLVKNIITRWSLAWYDISNNPWVIITLYNFWNIADKKPNATPKVWWATISIADYKYNFWWLWEWFYWWMKIFKKI